MSGPVREPPLLNWRDHPHRHTSPVELLCRHCRQPTYLLDDDRQPSHKVCAEQALACQATKAAAAYQEGTF